MCRPDEWEPLDPWQFMGHPDEKQSAAEIASAIFSMIDVSGDGCITTDELKSALKSTNPSLSVRSAHVAETFLAATSALRSRLPFM